MQRALKIDVIETGKRVTEGCKLGYEGGVRTPSGRGGRVAQFVQPV